MATSPNPIVFFDITIGGMHIFNSPRSVRQRVIEIPSQQHVPPLWCTIFKKYNAFEVPLRAVNSNACLC